MGCAIFLSLSAWSSMCSYTSIPSGKLARWALTIQEMDITIKHKSGKSNTNADALSRNPFPSGEVESLVCAVQSPDQTGELRCDNLRQEQANGSELVKLVHYCSSRGSEAREETVLGGTSI
jgi:hypothetical protein